MATPPPIVKKLDPVKFQMMITQPSMITKSDAKKTHGLVIISLYYIILSIYNQLNMWLQKGSGRRTWARYTKKSMIKGLASRQVLFRLLCSVLIHPLDQHANCVSHAVFNCIKPLITQLFPARIKSLVNLLLFNIIQKLFTGLRARSLNKSRVAAGTDIPLELFDLLRNLIFHK